MTVPEFVEAVWALAQANPKQITGIAVDDLTQYTLEGADGGKARKAAQPKRIITVRAHIPGDGWSWQSPGELILAPMSDVVLGFKPNADLKPISYWYIQPFVEVANRL